MPREPKRRRTRARRSSSLNCCRRAANIAVPPSGTSVIHRDRLAWALSQASLLINKLQQMLVCNHRLTSCC
eukprot:7666055-Alexandrium_andersonii.AAC.1